MCNLDGRPAASPGWAHLFGGWIVAGLRVPVVMLAVMEGCAVGNVAMGDAAERLVPSYDYRGTLCFWRVGRGGRWFRGPLHEVPGGLAGEALEGVVAGMMAMERLVGEVVPAVEREAVAVAEAPAVVGGGAAADAVACLRALGYGAREAARRVGRVTAADDGGSTAEAIVRLALAGGVA